MTEFADAPWNVLSARIVVQITRDCWHLIPGCVRSSLLAALAAGSGLLAQDPSALLTDPVPRPVVKRELARLIREDAAKANTAKQPAAPNPSSETPTDVVVLERYDVRGDKVLPNFTAPPETPVAKVLRTGTIMQHVGKKRTIRFWTSGDAGLVLSIRW